MMTKQGAIMKKLVSFNNEELEMTNERAYHSDNNEQISVNKERSSRANRDSYKRSLRITT